MRYVAGLRNAGSGSVGEGALGVDVDVCMGVDMGGRGVLGEGDGVVERGRERERKRVIVEGRGRAMGRRKGRDILAVCFGGGWRVEWWLGWWLYGVGGEVRLMSKFAWR